jgi:hypothetical protein
MRLLLALLAAGCGDVWFVDPTPPVLARGETTYTAQSAPEPIVWLPILDLFVEPGGSCSEARAWALGAIRNAMSAPGRGAELAAQDISPQCTQPAGRTVNSAAAQSALQAATATFPGERVRLIAVYANNIALPIDSTLLASIGDLRARTGAYLWVLAQSAISPGLQPDRSISWTYMFDPALAQAVTAGAASDLPLQRELPFAGAVDLVSPGAPVEQIKICHFPGDVLIVNAASDGRAAAVNPTYPPAMQLLYTPQADVPRAAFRPRTWSVDFETCATRCDRYYTAAPGDLKRWNDVRGCLL